MCSRPQRRPAHQSFYQSYSVNPITKRKRLLMAIDVRGYGAEIGKMRVFRPETGVWQVPRQDVLDKYSKVDAAKVKKQWLLDYDEAAKFCSHGPNCKHGNTCEVGKRVTHTTILTGALVDVWMKIERIVNQNTGWGESKVRLDIVRAIEKKDGGGGASASDGADDAAGGRQVIGLRIPNLYVDDVLEALKL